MTTAVSLNYNQKYTNDCNIDHFTEANKLRVGAGRPTILTPVEENEIVTSCQVLKELGFVLTRDIIIP